MPPAIEQIRFDENHLRQFIDPDLLDLFYKERIHLIDRDREAASIDHDPLYGAGGARASASAWRRR